MKKKPTNRKKIAAAPVVESQPAPVTLNVTVHQSVDARGAAEGLIEQLPQILQAANDQARKAITDQLREAQLRVVTPPKAAVSVRFCKVSSDGRALPPSATEWDGVYDATTGLIWGRRLLKGSERDWKASLKAAEESTLCGAPARAPTIQERLSIVDYTRVEPALDVTFFDPTEENAWEWTSTPAAAPSGFAWFVHLGGGGAGRFHQGYGNRVRAVRAGQPIGL
jgi:hypothetical protein